MTPDSPANPPLTYRDAGVDIDAGTSLVDRIKADAASTARPEVLGGLGGFGGLFQLPLERYRAPVLVSGTDGVGTKLALAVETGRHRGIGVDLVAMCVNDVVTSGAEPLFFLDYYATGRLDVDTAAEVVAGIAEGCRQAGCALIGGETAEMPGMYAPGHYDLAGFCVGIVERDAIVDGRRAAAGDVLLGVASSGVHANGYSLVRRVLERGPLGLDDSLEGTALAEALLAPTRIYVRAVRALLEAVDVHSLCHVTGGGLPENLPRVLPEALGARIDAGSWQRPALFHWLQRQGGVPDAEMWRTFNCGVGLVVALPAQQAAAALACMEAQGERAWILGEVVQAPADGARVVLEGVPA